MQGNITTYLPEKRYGFIKGLDGKDYFFHENNFLNKTDTPSLAEGALIEFDQAATPKGYQAKKCQLISGPEELRYIIPDTCLTTKSDTINGWELLERGDWVIFSTAKESYDYARDKLIKQAQRVGANALLTLRYSKSTESEPSESGKGTYYYSVHHLSARIATVGKRSFKGQYTKEELLGINQRADKLYHNLKKQRKQDISIALMIIVSAAVISLGLLLVNPIASAILVLFGGVFGFFLYPKDEIWLRKRPR